MSHNPPHIPKSHLKKGQKTTSMSFSYTYVLYVLLKALLPVCMKYTARGESRVANSYSMRRSQVLAIFVMRFSSRAVAIFYTNEAAVL